MHRFVMRLVALVMALGLIGAGCSDDEKSGLTKAGWIKAAGTVCSEGSAAFIQLFETGFPTTPEATADFFKKATPVVEQEIDGLKQLEPPDDLADDVDRALASGDQAIVEFRAATTDPEAAGELFEAEGGEHFDAYLKGMKDLGVPECDPDEGQEEEDEPVERLDPSSFSPEKAAFVEAGDAICSTVNETIRPAEDQYLEEFPPPLENWAGFLVALVPALEEGLDAFDALAPPAEDAEAIADLLAEQRSLLESFKEMLAAAESGDQEAFDEISGPVFPKVDEVDAAFAEYGFQVCGPEDEGEEEGGDGEDEGGEG